MRLAPFLLDQWLEQKFSADPPIEFDLGSSTGPIWTFRELLSLGGDLEQLLQAKLFYTPPAGSDELREELARIEGVQPEHVVVTTGAAESLLILFHLAAEPGANVVLPHPGFPTNEALAESLGLEVRRYRLRIENSFQVDPAEICKLVDHATKFVLVNSPHNPTGAVLSDAQMEALNNFCASRGVPFVCDQVYHPIYHGPAMRSAARLPHTTVLGDFSKALCLSGLRIGASKLLMPEVTLLFPAQRSASAWLLWRLGIVISFTIGHPVWRRPIFNCSTSCSPTMRSYCSGFVQPGA